MRQRTDGRGGRGLCGRRSLAGGLSAVALSASLLGGCASTRIDTEGTAAYPTELVQGETLDIQVFRRKGRVEFTNTTARSIGAGRMWLNQWYSREIEPLSPGESRSYQLDSFRDEFGESFRPGGFWATRPPDRLYLAQLEVERDGGPVLYGLVVVSDRPD